MMTRLGFLLIVCLMGLFRVSAAAEMHSPACDSSQCLLEDCLMPLMGTDAGIEGNITSQDFPTEPYPCQFPYEGRFVSVMQDETMGDFEEYTCCMPGYESMPVEVLENCSTEACTTPNNMGGYFCLADGFIQLMNCDQDSIYKYSRKESIGGLVTCEKFWRKKWLSGR